MAARAPLVHDLVAEELDLDLGEDVGCTIRIGPDEWDRVNQVRSQSEAPVCGKPAIVRVRTTCHSCGSTAVDFYCQEHYDDLRNGDIVCSECPSPLSLMKGPEL